MKPTDNPRGCKPVETTEWASVGPASRINSGRTRPRSWCGTPTLARCRPGAHTAGACSGYPRWKTSPGSASGADHMVSRAMANMATFLDTVFANGAMSAADDARVNFLGPRSSSRPRSLESVPTSG